MNDLKSVALYHSVKRKEFGLSSDVACIKGQKNKDKYAAYQMKYHQQYGVLPEFDTIHSPVTAMGDDIYYYYRQLKKRGFYGAWFYHDIHGFFNLKLKWFYNQYKKEWAFIFGLPAPIIENISSRMSHGESYEKIENGLGYRIENGVYYEGTWNNGKLTYGLMMPVAQEVFFIGSFDYSSLPGQVLYHGVEISCGKAKNEELIVLRFGTFAMKKDALVLYQNEGLEIINSNKDGISAQIGSYEEGYEEGKFLIKEFSHGEILISQGIYREGSLARDSFKNVFFRLFHMILAIYMIAYYMIKYTYGLFVFPIYRYIQRKNWR